MRKKEISFKEKLIPRYLERNKVYDRVEVKSTNINVLLNKIEVNKKIESRKKLYFSAVASTGLILFGLIIF